MPRLSQVRRAAPQNPEIASYALNPDAATHAEQLIDAHHYVLRSRWQDLQPRSREQMAFLKAHSFADDAHWHLGLTDGAPRLPPRIRLAPARGRGCRELLWMPARGPRRSVCAMSAIMNFA